MTDGNNVHTTTALRRWSCVDKQLPSVDRVKRIHVYDFDNTLFLSPLPNKQVWNTSTFGLLQAQEFLYNGGWWHNPQILAATGQGIDKEEPRAWEGSWNEKIVELCRLTMEDENAVNVLLTGRGEARFSTLLQRIIGSKGLKFDIVALKPTVSPSGAHISSTMMFKTMILKDIVYTYAQAEEIRVYEDRPKHTKAFRDFFADLNSDLLSSTSTGSLPVPRQPIVADVIQVPEAESFMDPVAEVQQVQSMINAHNQAIVDGAAPVGLVPYKIKRSVFYTGYLISPDDTERLKSLIQLPANCPEHEVKMLANNIIITPRPAPRSILDKVGGIGATMRWKVIGVANFERRVWAARVQPATPGAKIYTENNTPCVVLATRRQSKPIDATKIHSWQPVPEGSAFEFNTTVGEKVLLRIDEEVRNEDDYEASFPNAKNARKHGRDDDFPPLGPRNGPKHAMPPRPQQRSQGGNGAWSGNRSGGIGFAAQRGNMNSNGPRGGRGGQQGFRGGRRGNDRGGGGGGGGRGRGRGAYKSLDANVGQGYGMSGMEY